MKGFDYVKGQPLELPRKEWIARLAAVVQGGGFRRVEKGETFAHAKGGAIAFEVYAILPAPVLTTTTERRRVGIVG